MERYCTYHETIVPRTIVDKHGNNTKLIDVTHVTNHGHIIGFLGTYHG